MTKPISTKRSIMSHRRFQVSSFFSVCVIISITINCIIVTTTSAFMHSPVKTKCWPTTLSILNWNQNQLSLMRELQMARKSKNNSSPPNKKAKKNTKSKGKESRIGKSKISSTAKKTGTSSNDLSKKISSNQHLPPWQIMSTKDIQKNIKSEKERREGIRSGEIASSVTNSSLKTADASASSSLLEPTDRQLLNWKRFRPDKDINGLTFIGAYLGRDFIPPSGCPEVAFLGRSNVGKSSLLNRLVKSVSDGGSEPNENDSARVGKTPGATASVNIYSIIGKNKNRPLLGFADLPGFGYAKLSKEVKESVEMAAERYLGKRKELALGILLVDVRRTPSDDDRAVLAALYDMGVPILVVATKVDKIRSNVALSDALKEVRIGLGLPEGQPLQISSVTGEGIKQLWGIILDACEDKIYYVKEDIEGVNNNVNEHDPDEPFALDDEGNLIIEEEEPLAEGLEWVRNFAYYDDSKDNDKRKYELSDESIIKMKQNEARQAAENEAMKPKNLRKIARKMERHGEV